MPRYFMGGTPLSGLERMMMDPSRSPHDDAQDERAEKRPRRGQPDNPTPPKSEGEEDIV